MLPTSRRSKTSHEPPLHQRAEDTKPRKVRLAGTVWVTTDNGGRIAAARLRGADGSGDYAIVLDEDGLRLAEQMAGNNAVVEGTIVLHDHSKALRVRRFRHAKPRDPSLQEERKP